MAHTCPCYLGSMPISFSSRKLWWLWVGIRNQKWDGNEGPKPWKRRSRNLKTPCHHFKLLVNQNGCFRKKWYPQIIHFNRVFHSKPSVLGYPYFWKHPNGIRQNFKFLEFLWFFGRGRDIIFSGGRSGSPGSPALLRSSSCSSQEHGQPPSSAVRSSHQTL